MNIKWTSEFKIATIFLVTSVLEFIWKNEFDPKAYYKQNRSMNGIIKFFFLLLILLQFD